MEKLLKYSRILKYYTPVPKLDIRFPTFAIMKICPPLAIVEYAW